jgi:RNA polymerase-binding protein DksA
MVKKAMKKSAGKTGAPAGKIAHKPVAKKVAPKKNIKVKPAKVATVKKPQVKPVVETRKKMSAAEKKEVRDMLIAMRRRFSGHIASLQSDSLKRDDEVNLAEDGTDTFERQFALTLASAEQDALFDVDDALRRLDENTYGLCEECGAVVGIIRLKALPFVRKCIQCQSKTENGRRPRSQAVLEKL